MSPVPGIGYSLGSLAARFGCELIGDPDAEVSSVATLANADADAISFLANPLYKSDLSDTAAAAVIVRPEDADECPVAAMIAADPYLVYARVAALLYPPPAPIPGVHPSAVVEKTAHVHPGAQICALAYVGANSRIADGAYVGVGSVVGPRCTIGAGTRVDANVSLIEDVRIGERTIVHAGVVVGSDGFGNTPTDGGWLKVPQLGGVTIGSDVEIGANTSIDRGAIDDTVIEDGVRLDNQIQIAHNCRIGAHTVIAALTGVSGSTQIGQRCIIAGQVGFVGHISICDDVKVTGDAVVTKSITTPGTYSASFAAEDDREWKRKVARFRRLDSLSRRLKELEKQTHD